MKRHSDYWSSGCAVIQALRYIWVTNCVYMTKESQTTYLWMSIEANLFGPHDNSIETYMSHELCVYDKIGINLEYTSKDSRTMYGWEFSPINYSLRGIIYGVATMSRLLKITGLFCRIPSLEWGSSAKETYNFKEPTNCSHPIPYIYMHFRDFNKMFES